MKSKNSNLLNLTDEQQKQFFVIIFDDATCKQNNHSDNSGIW